MDVSLLTSSCLNPFEVREVLQGIDEVDFDLFKLVSIPLKSGRCCKEERMRSQLRQGVSIPLKSGRCCKLVKKEKIEKSEVSIPLKSGRCCKETRRQRPLVIQSQSL